MLVAASVNADCDAFVDTTVCWDSIDVVVVGASRDAPSACYGGGCMYPAERGVLVDYVYADDCDVGKLYGGGGGAAWCCIWAVR